MNLRYDHVDGERIAGAFDRLERKMKTGKCQRNGQLATWNAEKPHGTWTNDIKYIYCLYSWKERKMTDNANSESLGLSVDRHDVDLGADVDRDAGNRGSALSDTSSAGLEGGLDPGNTDLGDDVFRNEANEGAVLSDTDGPGLEGGLDPGNTDLGDDVHRSA